MPKIEKIHGLKHIYKVESFNDELDSLFKKNKGARQRFESWLYLQLSILDRMGMEALKLENFEKLKTDPPLYAIRHPHSILNERYIYIYCDGEDVLLLSAFKEKSTSDYNPAIQRAHNLIKELEE